jgi:asparagine synthase (glutamine-hydrolysing)
MCGLAGTYRRDADVDAMLDQIAHRGPDGRNIARHGSAIHGHVRLALVDLTDASAQPYKYCDALLSFVGEIWNYRELRGMLPVQFRTTGDTEVLAAALYEWGVASTLPLLDGMFAFVWSRGEETICARDRFGKVPMYVTRYLDGSAEWCTERKGLSVQGNALPAGSMITLSTGAVGRWYTVGGGLHAISPDGVFSMLSGAVKKRLSADAPVCVLISGGLDSALILTLAKKARPDVIAYTATFNPKSADTLAARRLCTDIGVELREVFIDQPTTDDIDAAINAIEIPMKAQVEIAILCLPLAEQIARDGFKACLSGEGADELFGGYGSMAIKASAGGDMLWRTIRTQQVNKMARGNFIRCNKAFMAHGVECRLPYLDYPLVEGVLATSKHDCPPGKGLLKEAARGTVPEWIIKRPKATFQGASGMAEAISRIIASPTRYYNARTRSIFGALIGG